MAVKGGDGGLTVALVGATGAVGRDMLEVLGRSGLPIADLRLVASRGNQEGALSVGEHRYRVHPMPEHAASAPLFEGVDLVFFATPPDVTRLHGPALAAEGVAVIDIGGALSDQGPLVVPAVSLAPLERFTASRIACSPSAPAVALATLLAPLVPVGLVGCHAVVMLSAGLFGREGTEELSGQVVSLFNQQDPPRRVFPSGLAFDIVASSGDDVEGWSGVERALVLEVAVLTGLPPMALASTVLAVPLFTGLAMSIQLDFDDPPPLEDLRAALDGARSVRFGDPAPGPRRAAGKAAVFAGRLRADHRGAVHLWATADNLRFGATANALAIASAVLSEGLL